MTRRVREGSEYRDLHAVDWRQRVEQAAPVLAAVAPHPQLARRSAEIESGFLELIDVQRVALDREEAFLLRQAAREAFPGIAAVCASPHCGRAARTGARHRLQRHHVDRVGVVRMYHDREAEIGRQRLTRSEE